MNAKYKRKVKNFSILFSVCLIFGFLTCSVSAHTISTLVWQAPTTNTDGSALDDLAGYKIYYGESPVDASNCPAGYPAENTIDTKSTSTSYDLSNILAEGKTYYFQVTAYDSSGNESACSTDPGQVSKLITFSSDLNVDYKVDIFDFNIFLPTFGQTGDNLLADTNRDGKVDIQDYNIFVVDFGKNF